MFTWLRSILYVLWLYGSLAVIGIAFLPAMILPRKATRFGMTCWAAAARWGLRWICGVTTEVRGIENLPDGPCIVASKHQAMYDTIAPFLFLPDPAFILKRELMFYPIFGWYAWKSRMIPIDRGGALKTLKIMAKRAKEEATQNRQILIFPEGTRQAPGAKPDYKPGVVMLYREMDVPCVPIALNTGLCWPAKGIKRIPGKIVFEILPPIPSGLNRKEFMQRLQSDIETASERLLEEGLRAQNKADLAEATEGV